MAILLDCPKVIGSAVRMVAQLGCLLVVGLVVQLVSWSVSLLVDLMASK